MKIIKIILKDFCHLFKAHKWLSCLLVIGLISCNLMALYFCGNIIGVSRNLNTPVWDLDLTADAVPDIVELAGLAARNEAKVSFFTYAETESLKSENNAAFDIDGYGKVFPSYDGTSLLSIVAFSEKPIQRLDKGNAADLNNSLTIALPSVMQGDSNIGDRFFIDGVGYTVVGYEIGDTAFVSLDTFEKIALYVPHMEVRRQTSDKEQIAEFEKELKGFFSGTYRIVRRNNTDENNTIEYLAAVSVIIFIICVLSVMYLVSSIFNELSYESGVYYMVGARREAVVCILSGVQLLILAVSGFGAVAVHKVLWKTVFSKINLYEITYSAKEYFLYISFVTVLIFAIEIFRNIKSVRLSPIVYSLQHKK